MGSFSTTSGSFLLKNMLSMWKATELLTTEIVYSTMLSSNFPYLFSCRVSTALSAASTLTLAAANGAAADAVAAGAVAAGAVAAGAAGGAAATDAAGVRGRTSTVSAASAMTSIMRCLPKDFALCNGASGGDAETGSVAATLGLRSVDDFVGAVLR